MENQEFTDISKRISMIVRLSWLGMAIGFMLGLFTHILYSMLRL